MQELIFTQEKNSYRYNLDSFLLFDFVRGAKLKGRVLDVGCGCGIIGILLKASYANIALSLLDFMKKNCELASLNLSQNKIEAEILCEDFSSFKSETKFDAIVSNPPFYREEALKAKNELKQRARSSSFLSLKDFIKTSSSLLKPQGRLYFCYEAGALQELCVSLLEKKFKLIKLVLVHKDASKKARLALIEAKKSSRSPCEILSPIFVYEKEGLSKKMQDIYKSIKVRSVDL